MTHTAIGTVVECAVPCWDCLRRELRFRGRLVKRLRVPAPNQDLIFSAFEECGWAAAIDDPLPQERDLDPKRRLADTIKALNRCQRSPLIRFRGNGTGTQIVWDAVVGHIRRPRRTPRTKR